MFEISRLCAKAESIKAFICVFSKLAVRLFFHDVRAQLIGWQLKFYFYCLHTFRRQMAHFIGSLSYTSFRLPSTKARNNRISSNIYIENVRKGHLCGYVSGARLCPPYARSCVYCLFHVYTSSKLRRKIKGRKKMSREKKK